VVFISAYLKIVIIYRWYTKVMQAFFCTILHHSDYQSWHTLHKSVYVFIIQNPYSSPLTTAFAPNKLFISIGYHKLWQIFSIPCTVLHQ